MGWWGSWRGAAGVDTRGVEDGTGGAMEMQERDELEGWAELEGSEFEGATELVGWVAIGAGWGAGVGVVVGLVAVVGRGSDGMGWGGWALDCGAAVELAECVLGRDSGSGSGGRSRLASFSRRGMRDSRVMGSWVGWGRAVCGLWDSVLGVAAVEGGWRRGASGLKRARR